MMCRAFLLLLCILGHAQGQPPRAKGPYDGKGSGGHGKGPRDGGGDSEYYYGDPDGKGKGYGPNVGKGKGGGDGKGDGGTITQKGKLVAQHVADILVPQLTAHISAQIAAATQQIIAAVNPPEPPDPDWFQLPYDIQPDHPQTWYCRTHGDNHPDYEEGGEWLPRTDFASAQRGNRAKERRCHDCVAKFRDIPEPPPPPTE